MTGDTIAHIRAHAVELAAIARQNGRPFLGQLLDMAALECMEPARPDQPHDVEDRPKRFRDELPLGAEPPGGALGAIALRLADVHERRGLERLGVEGVGLSTASAVARFDAFDRMLAALRALSADDVEVVAAEVLR